jgi:glycosyltransferase involved in cell wall biosynthesis
MSAFEGPQPSVPGPAGPAAAPAHRYRVLMVAPTSFFADYGCHVRILEEARILQRWGHQVAIASYYNGHDVSGLDIRRTLPIPWRQHYEVGSSRHKIAFDALLAWKVLGLLARERFDVLHVHLHEGALLGALLGRLFRVPVVFDFQGSMTEEMIDHHFLRRDSRLFPPLRRLETWLDRSAPVVLTSSVHAQRLLVERSGCDPERVQTLPDCVNAQVFRPASQHDPAALAQLRRHLGIPENRRLLVYLGKLAEYQGISLLLEALQRIVRKRQDVHLLLMGFPYVDYYRERAAQLGLQEFVTLTGRVPYDQAPTYLALGDVAAAPKMSLTEGAGKLLNYMAVGLPTVAFDTPVAREYLGLDGFLAQPGSVESLAEKLYLCLFPAEGVPDPCLGMGERLRQRAVQHFDWEMAGRQIVATYEALLGATRRRSSLRRRWAAIRE